MPQGERQSTSPRWLAFVTVSPQLNTGGATSLVFPAFPFGLPFVRETRPRLAKTSATFLKLFQKNKQKKTGEKSKLLPTRYPASVVTWCSPCAALGRTL